MNTQSVLITAILTAVLITSSTATAESEELALAISERGLTLGHFNLAVGVDGIVLLTPGDPVAGAALPVRFGLGDDFEVFFSPVLQNQAPHLRDPAIGAIYRLVGGGLEVGARVAGDLAIFGDDKIIAADLGVPVRIHFGSSLAIDTGIFGRFDVEPQAIQGLRVPLGLTYNALQRLALSASISLLVADVTDSQRLDAPLDLAASWTIDSEGRPFVELGARVTLPTLRDTDFVAATAFARLFFLAL